MARDSLGPRVTVIPGHSRSIEVLLLLLLLLLPPFGVLKGPSFHTPSPLTTGVEVEVEAAAAASGIGVELDPSGLGETGASLLLLAAHSPTRHTFLITTSMPKGFFKVRVTPKGSPAYLSTTLPIMAGVGEKVGGMKGLFPLPPLPLTPL